MVVRAAALVIAAGVALRVVLAFVAFPRQGFAPDLAFFASWATTIARTGPAHFYAAAPGSDYPPGYLYVLWALATLAGANLETLLKLPAIAADAAVALLLLRAGSRWFGPRAGVIAAALYLFVPVTWYDSALWGQADAVGALFVVVALVFLIEERAELAVAATALAIVVKPQEAIPLLVVVPVLVRRHALLRTSPVRLATSALAGAATLVLALLPSDIERYAAPSIAPVPIMGSLAGLAGLVQANAERYHVLTANAYNLWALVGREPLANVIGSGDGAWIRDDIALSGGVRAVTVGAALFAVLAGVVVIGLLARDGPLAILLAFTLVAFGFYALPTRVHERYLFPFFASGALLGARYLGAGVAYLVVGALNTTNLHAILAAPLSIITDVDPVPVGGAPATDPAPVVASASQLAPIHLPLAALARSEAVVALVAVGQTAALVALAAWWIVVIARPPSGKRMVEAAPYPA
jgi:dolichyl-phosphate-mannose-protein mannosyltransferase